MPAPHPHLFFFHQKKRDEGPKKGKAKIVKISQVIFEDRKAKLAVNQLNMGPHVLGLELMGSEGSEKAEAGGGAEPIDPLGQFLIDCTSPLRAALLPNPVDGGKQDGGADGKLTRRSSGRLAAKPTAKWSTMDKVQLVLMKKGDVWAGDSPAVDATAADLQKYRDLYKQPLPDKFVAAVTELVNSMGGHGKKTGHVELEQALVAAA